MSGSILKRVKKPHLEALFRGPQEEELGLSKEQQIVLMKVLGIYSLDSEKVINSKAYTCPDCGKYYFPSGSNEQRCWQCARKRDRKYIREYMRNRRSSKNHYKLQM